MQRILEKKVSSLDISEDIIFKLNNNNINTINDLWNLKRADLKKFLSDREITNIIVKLQLIGIDLNKKVYKNK